MSHCRGFRLLQLSLLFLLCAWVSLASGQVGAPVGNGGPGPAKALHLTVEMVSAGPAVAKGGGQTVGFVFSMEDGWHVYWQNAGFAGFPPRVSWTLPAGVTAGPLQFPAPERLPLSTTVDYGYQDNVAYPVAISAGPGARADGAGNIHLAAAVSWLVCKQVCIPGKANLGLDLKLAPEGAAVSHEGEQVGPLGAALKRMPKPLPERFTFAANASASQIVLTTHLGETPEDIEFYPMEQDVIADGDQKVTKTGDGALVIMERSPEAKVLPKSLHGLLKLTPEETYVVDVPIVAGGVPTTVAKAGGGSSVAGVTALGAIALAFAGGILLNLMPCVFPVLFLKALALLQTSGEERGRLRSHGVAYTLGIVASFWLIVAVLLALRAGGKEFGWGFQLQSPGFVAVLAAFLFFFALSLTGVFELGLSLTSKGGALAEKGGYSGSFFTGVLATVVATPCVGPFMGAAIGFALSQPAYVTFLVFTSLALGLAAPYLALSLQPAWVRFLPRPGAWMEILKQITALPLFATVIWLVYIYGRLFTGGSDAAEGITRVAWLLACLLLIAVAAWVLGRWPAKRGATIAAAALAVLAVALPLSAAHESAGKLEWKPFSAEDVQQARREGKAVFVDFTAAWCLSCQVNERLVLNSAEVQKRLRDGSVVPMRADWTQYDPKITAALGAVGRSGVPTYIVYPAKPDAAPDVLPEILNKGVVLEAMQRDLRR